MATGTINKFDKVSDVITSYLPDTGWQAKTNSGAYSGTIYVREWGNVVCIHSSGLKLASALSSGSYRSLHSGIVSGKPNVVIRVPAGNNNRWGQVELNGNGNLGFYRNTSSTWSTSDTIDFVITYLKA